MGETTQSKPTVLITGAAGLIGSALIRRMGSAYDVVAFDIEEPKDVGAPHDFIYCDLTDEEWVRRSLEQLRRMHGSHLVSAIHMAAHCDFSGEPSPLYEQLTVEGTRRLITALHGFEVEQLVFASSLLVVAPAQKGEWLDESSPTEAEWEYPRSKLAAEAVIRQQQGDIPAVILRIADVYDEDGQSLPIAQQIKRIYENELEGHFFPGNSERGQSFVHLEDVVDCLVRTVERRRDLGHSELLLIGERDAISYGDLQCRVGELLHGEEWTTRRMPKWRAQTGVCVQNKPSSRDEEPCIEPWMVDLADAHYPINPAKAEARLGWRPRHSLSDALPEMLSRLKGNPQRWYEINGLPLPSGAAH